MTSKIEGVIVKIWDMALASVKSEGPVLVCKATLEWAREELELKLPENPYPARPLGNLGTAFANLKYQIFAEAIQAVKELNK